MMDDCNLDNMALLGKRLGFIGAGNMAAALVEGLLASGVTDKENITLSDPAVERRQFFRESFDIPVIRDNKEVVRHADVVILAVKPQQMRAALLDIKGVITPQYMVLSIAAGIPLRLIEDVLAVPCRLMRAMPNTPVLVGAGTVGLYRGPRASQDDLDVATTIFGSSAVVIPVTEESHLDAITAVSGSGPAYVFYFLESLIAGALTLGLSEEQAALACQQTFLGSVKLLMRTGKPAGELRRQVTSPGGTTQAAIETMQSEGFQEIVESALKAARDRAIVLGRQA